METQKRIQTIIATRSTPERRKALQDYAIQNNRKMMDVVNGLIDNLLAGEPLNPVPQPRKIEDIIEEAKQFRLKVRKMVLEDDYMKKNPDAINAWDHMNLKILGFCREAFSQYLQEQQKKIGG